VSLSTGTHLGPYEIQAAIGAGGMGEVYRARDTRLGRDVAVKVVPASFSDDPTRVVRFEQEARAAAALSHPNILAVHDVGFQDGVHYIVSELLEGETLRERLRAGPLPTRKAIDYALLLARGLAAAHARGIVHRDLKPENVFVTSDGQIKILDFGLAKLTRPEWIPDAQTVTGQIASAPGVVLGTLGYMSPEQVRGAAADERSDLFSAGAILYEMLSGKRAFHGDSSADTITAILQSDPPEMSDTNRPIPPALERIVRHCLEKNPAERFQSAHDLAFDLELLSGSSGASRPAALAAQPVRRRRWLVPALIAAALVVSSAVAYVVGVRAARAEQPAFSRLTFRHGAIRSARFTPDGRTIVYGAAWEGKPVELFAVRAGSFESRALGLGNAEILSIAKSGEMAVLVRARTHLYPFESVGTLARVPADGSAARELLDNVAFADWAPNGEDLAIVRPGPPGRLEYPPGKTLHDPGTGWVSHARFSPDGKLIAFLEHWQGGDDGWVSVVDLAGRAQKLTAQFSTVEGLAWAPDGKEVLFAASPAGAGRSIYAVDLSRRLRVVLRTAGSFWLHDVAPDGRIVVSQSSERMGVKALPPGANDEVDLSWFDWSLLHDMSRDGKTIIFGESGEASGGRERYGLFARNVDGSPAVRLADGDAGKISDDNKWVVGVSLGNPPQLRIWPTGAGQSRTLNLGSLVPVGARFFPGGRRLVVFGSEPGHRLRVYLFDMETSAARPLTPEGALGGILSPDGNYVLSLDEDGEKVWLYPTEGGDRRAALGFEKGELPQDWTKASPPLIVASRGVPAKVFRIDPFTGDRQFWKELVPSDPAGILMLGGLAASEKCDAYAYSYYRVLSDLYLLEAVK